MNVMERTANDAKTVRLDGGDLHAVHGVRERKRGEVTVIQVLILVGNTRRRWMDISGPSITARVESWYDPQPI